jgi:hypothetical protein
LEFFHHDKNKWRLQGSKGILDHGNRTQANVISVLDLFNVSLGRTWYCFDAFMELIGLASLFLLLCLKLLKSRWKLG